MTIVADTVLFQVPRVVNEPVRSYCPDTGALADTVMPHRHAHLLRQAHRARTNDVFAAIAAASDWWGLPGRITRRCRELPKNIASHMGETEL
jgi:hypothetical protein